MRVRRMSAWRLAAAMVAFACALTAITSFGASHTAPPAEYAGPAIKVRHSGKPAAVQERRTLLLVRHVAVAVARVFHQAPRGLTLHFYVSQAGFSRALFRSEHLWPQNSGDDTGNIVYGVLPLGPQVGANSHRLAHVYTEWVIDGLTHNRTDRQPSPAWLYDGLAEYVANHVGGVALCRGTTSIPLALRSISAPSDWWRIRGGPFGPLEYCKAESQVQQIVSRLGWARVLELLTHSGSWRRFASSVGAAP